MCILYHVGPNIKLLSHTLQLIHVSVRNPFHLMTDKGYDKCYMHTNHIIINCLIFHFMLRPLQKLATEVDSLLQNFVYFGWNVSIAAHNSVHILLIIAFIVHTLRIGHNDVVNPPSLVSALLKHAGQLGTMKE